MSRCIDSAGSIERVLESARMKKDLRFTFRIGSDLKKDLEKIAAQEGRSVAQICDAFLKAGTEAYRKNDKHKEMYREFARRDGANAAWIASTFSHARLVQAKAIVFFWQADFRLAEPPYHDHAYDLTKIAIQRGAESFDGEVLIVHGDSHAYEIDGTFKGIDLEVIKTANGTKVVHRYQVPGDANENVTGHPANAIYVTVNTDAESGQSVFTPQLVCSVPGIQCSK